MAITIMNYDVDGGDEDDAGGDDTDDDGEWRWRCWSLLLISHPHR